jgi:hypothetical protein
MSLDRSKKSVSVQASSDSATSGTAAKAGLTTSVSPTANTTQVLINYRSQINYNSSSNVTTGGYLCAGQDVINTSGTGTHDKMVARMAQMNLTGGNVSAAVGFESVISQIGAGTAISGLALYYVPNMASVANFGNIGTVAAFSNDEPRAILRSAGPFLNADLRELSPSNHIGLIAGRYYSAPAKSMTQSAVAANVIYVTYVHVPHRTTITRIGFDVATASAGNARIGMYKVANGALTSLVVQGANLDTGTTGVKESVISAQVDSGIYAVVAVFSATPTIRWHEINGNSMTGALSSSGFSEQAYITPFSFGALPGTANITPTFAANTIEPHFWFRVGV